MTPAANRPYRSENGNCFARPRAQRALRPISLLRFEILWILRIEGGMVLLYPA